MKEDLKVDIQNLIDVVQELLIELKKKGFTKHNKQTAFQKTEQLLYNYMNFKQVIADKQKAIEQIKQEGIQKRSKSIVSYSGNHLLHAFMIKGGEDYAYRLLCLQTK